MDATADRDGFVAVYPSGTGRGTRALTWNAADAARMPSANKIDDVGFTKSLLDDLCIARSHRSNAGLCDRHLEWRDDGVSAGHRGLGSCRRDRARGGRADGRDVSAGASDALMLFNSVDDRYVPYGRPFLDGSGDCSATPFPPVDEEIRAIGANLTVAPAAAAGRAGAQGCASSPDADNSATRYEWGPCGDGSRIVLWKLAGSGHVLARARCTAGRGWGAERSPQRQRSDVAVLPQFFPAVG